jgi:hypothetical protein
LGHLGPCWVYSKFPDQGFPCLYFEIDFFIFPGDFVSDIVCKNKVKIKSDRNMYTTFGYIFLCQICFALSLMQTNMLTVKLGNFMQDYMFTDIWQWSHIKCMALVAELWHEQFCSLFIIRYNIKYTLHTRYAQVKSNV